MNTIFKDDADLIYESYKRSYGETRSDEDESTDEARRSKYESERDIMDGSMGKIKNPYDSGNQVGYESPLYTFASSNKLIEKEGPEMRIAMEYMLGEKVPVKIKLNKDLIIEPFKKLNKVCVWAILTSAKLGSLEMYNTEDKNIAENIEKVIDKAFKL